MDSIKWENHIKMAGGDGIIAIVRRALNLVDPRLMQHGTRVAAIMSKMIESQGKYNELEVRDICIAAMLHDIGAYKTEEIDQMVQFETGNVWDHSIYGYLFLKYFSPLPRWAELLLFHHDAWKDLKKREGVSRETMELAQILNLADRADLFFEQTHGTIEELTERLRSQHSGTFMPEAVELLITTQWPESFFEKNSHEPEFIFDNVELQPEEMEEYLRMIVFAIDFRSYCTVTHTIVTAGISREVARRLGMTKEEEQEIVTGAVVHDLGKIGIPVHILEFPGSLSSEKMAIMRTHVDLTEQILGLDVAEPICNIALRHHEKLDGSGYPRGLHGDEINISQRIVAVADIVSALNGERSYKGGFSKEETVRIVGGMGREGLLDKTVVDLIISEFDEIMEAVSQLCKPVLKAYDGINDEFSCLREAFIPSCRA